MNASRLLLVISVLFGISLKFIETGLRSKRFLIFPRQAPTRHQFIVGFGIPVDLELEALTEGYVLKAEYWLPYNATVYRQNPYPIQYYKNGQPINGRSDDAESILREKRSNLRWNIYAFIEDRLESHGYNGLECMQKSICEANSVKFVQNFDIFAELMHIFFSPMTSVDNDHENRIHYVEAEKIGRAGSSCDFYACNLSLVDLISNVFKL